MAEETLDYAPNYAHTLEIDVTPDSDKKTWASALVGITSCVPASDETVNEDAHYDDLGSTETSVDAVKVSLALTGHRKYGDPAQDFIQSRALSTGKKRHTDYRWIQPDGTLYEGDLTMADVIAGSGMGDANSRGDFSWTAKLNTINETPAKNTVMPTGVTVSEVSVTTKNPKQASVTVQPEGCNQKCHYAVEDDSIATVTPDGMVTGVKAGKTKLTVKAAACPSVMATVEVEVTAG